MSYPPEGAQDAPTRQQSPEAPRAEIHYLDKMFAPAPGFEPESGGDPPALSPLERAKLDKNDRGNARRLEATVGRDLVYCREWGWGVWTGTHYAFDAGEIRALDLCMALQDIIEEEACAWRDAPVDEVAIAREIQADAKRQPKDRKGATDQESAEKVIRTRRHVELVKWAESCGNVSMVDRAMKVLRPLVRVSLDDLDAAPHLLTVQNGLVDLAEVAKPAPAAEEDDERLARWRGFLKRNERQGRPTRVCNAAFVPGTPRPKFQAFLDLIQPQPHLQAYLKRCCGQMLSGSNDYQVALLWQGEGATGKSTLMSILSSVLGSYVADCKIEMFLATELRSSSAATPDEADLPGARVYTASEPEPNAALSDAKVKAFTGGDPRKSRANYGDPFRWRPLGVPVLSFNRMPSIKGDSYGTRRRLAFVPFTANLRNLPEDRQRAQAEVEAEMVPEYPGILDWLLEGYAEARALGGLIPPPEADTLKEALMSDADPVGEFIAACCAHDEAGRVRTSDFYRTYAAWAEDSGARTWRDSTVKKVMVQKGYRASKCEGYPHFHGLRWNGEEATEDYRHRSRLGSSPDTSRALR